MQLYKSTGFFGLFLKWSAMLFAISFCLGLALNSIGMVIFLIAGITVSVKDLLSGELKWNYRELNYPLGLLFFVIFCREFFLTHTGWEMAVLDYFSFLLLPLVIMLQSKRLQTFFPNIFLAFLVGCVLSASINVSYAIFRGFIMNNGGINFWYFTYDFLAEPIGVQPIYLGMFYVFGLLILFTYENLIKPKAFMYSCIIILVMSVFLLAARNAIVCLIVLLPLYLLVRKKLSFKKLALGIAVVGSCFSLALLNPVIKNRIFKANSKGNVYSGTSLRTSIWQSAISAAKNNEVWGSGKKKGSELLLEEFETRKLEVPLKYKYHSHNQFLHTWVQYGLVGVLFLMVVFLMPLGLTFSRKNYLGVFWSLLILLTAMTESVFTRQWGIFSFAFFSSLFLLTPKQTQPLA
ncbi:MAG: O-antigen ligase family protein [Pricia sp.]